MKKIFSILCTVLALSAVSCGGAGSKPTADECSASNTVSENNGMSFTFSEKGVSYVTLGMSASVIPDSIAGLYNHVDKYEGKSFIGYSFVLDSIETFSAEDTDYDGIINRIAVRGESPLKAATGNGKIYIGMPEADLLDPKGDILVTKKDGFYRIGNFKVEVQDGKVNEIYIEWAPSISDVRN